MKRGNSLPYTGERMIPFATGKVVETHHWQRYLFFRPWYEGAKIIDAGCGEGYGADYASTFAKEMIGIDQSQETTTYANYRYPHCKFQTADVCQVDFESADLVLCLHTLEQLEEPEKLLKRLASANARVVISVSNPVSWRNGAREREFIKHSWTPTQFKDLIEKSFPDRTVRFLSQKRDWPGNVTSEFLENSVSTIAVIGDGELPQWPSVGIGTATYNNWQQLDEAIFAFSRGYPGKIRFAVVANGCCHEELAIMREAQASNPNFIHLIEESENRGFAVGMNIALDFLRREERHDLYAITNDDVIPAVDCLSEMVHAMAELQNGGHNPGVIGPVSNSITGQQQVDIGNFSDYISLMPRAAEYHRKHHSTVSQVAQLRGLFMLIHPECLRAVGGFDPQFGLGNFEDDDYNLRCTLAGFTNWIAEGAFLFHHGSSTFRRLGVDYASSIARNAERMRKKWTLDNVEDWPSITQVPSGVDLFIPLGRPLHQEELFPVRVNGEQIDLVKQATDDEFAGWVADRLQDKPSDFRKAVIELIEGRRMSA